MSAECHYGFLLNYFDSMEENKKFLCEIVNCFGSASDSAETGNLNTAVAEMAWVLQS